MKDLLPQAGVVVRASIMKISHHHLADYVTHVQHDYFSSSNQSNHRFAVVVS